MLKSFQDLHHLFHHLSCLLLLLFLAIVRNFIFSPCVVPTKFRKRKNIFWAGYTIPDCFSIWYVWIFILLHLICTHSWHLSHCTALWFFATGLLQILHGDFIGMFKSSYGSSNFRFLLSLQLIIVKFTFCLRVCWAQK